MNEEPQAVEQSTKAYIVTKALLQRFGLVRTQIVTAFLLTLPEADSRQPDLEHGAIWFKPNHKAIMKSNNIKESVYWPMLGMCVDAQLLMTNPDLPSYFSPNFFLIDEITNELEMSEEEAEAEIRATEQALLEQNREKGEFEIVDDVIATN